MFRGIAVAGLLVAVGGCSLITDEDGSHRERLVGVVFFSATPSITVPDSVDSNVAFPVTIQTLGNPCTEKGEVEVTLLGSTALLTPYDYHPRIACDDRGVILQHVVHVQFAQPGTAWVVVAGRGSTANGLLTAERSVIVK